MGLVTGYPESNSAAHGTIWRSKSNEIQSPRHYLVRVIVAFILFTVAFTVAVFYHFGGLMVPLYAIGLGIVSFGYRILIWLSTLLEKRQQQ